MSLTIVKRMALDRTHIQFVNVFFNVADVVDSSGFDGFCHFQIRSFHRGLYRNDIRWKSSLHLRECFICVQIQRQCAAILQPYFATNAVVAKCLEHGQSLEHVMDYTKLRALTSLFSMLNQAVRNVLNYNHNHPDFPMPVFTTDLCLQQTHWLLLHFDYFLWSSLQ